MRIYINKSNKIIKILNGNRPNLLNNIEFISGNDTNNISQALADYIQCYLNQLSFFIKEILMIQWNDNQPKY